MRNRSFVSSSTRLFSWILAALFATGVICFTPIAVQAQAVKFNGAAENFGSVNLGQSSSTYSFAFSFTASTHVGSIAVLTQGVTGKDFLSSGGTCKTGTYGSGASCTVSAYFKPLAPGARLGAVVLYDTSTPPNALATAYIYGTGVGPAIAFGPGIISTFVSTSKLAYPIGIAIDAAGNLYIGDSGHQTVRKVTSGGAVTTVAGGAQLGAVCSAATDQVGDGCPATSAYLGSPTGVAVDGAGNLYISDDGQGTYGVRKVSRNGTISAVTWFPNVATLGCPQQTDAVGDGCPAANAQLNNPYGVAVDGTGNLYISDTDDNLVRKVAPNGVINIVAGTFAIGPDGNPLTGYSGDGGPATKAQLNAPTGIVADSAGDLYISDFGNDVIRKVAANGTITTVAGMYITAVGIPEGGYDGDGGPATKAQLNSPRGIALDAADDLYIADGSNCVVREVTAGGTITTVAGDHAAGCGSSGNGGPATSAQFTFLAGVALDASGNLYISDSVADAIRKVDVSDAPSLAFTSTKVGTVSASQDVVIENRGNASLDITRISIAANFILGGSLTSCADSGQLLASGMSCILGIEFAPQEPGTVKGTVTLTDNSLNAGKATQQINLSGISAK